MDISKRLLTVASAVTPGNRVADVGTDHGYVPIFLVKKGIVPSAIAMDINEGPLKKADSHIREEGLADLIVTRRSDGMEKLNENEVDTVVIAGMGGELTSRILKSRADLLKNGLELVLSPHSEWYKVRHTLHQMDYRIDREWFLKDEGKYYVVMKAHPGSQSFSSESEYCYGASLEKECEPVLMEYIENKRKKLEKVVEAIRSQDDREEKNLCRREQRISELMKEMDLMNEKLERLRAGR